MNVSGRRLEVLVVLPKRSRQVGNAGSDSLESRFQLGHKIGLVYKPDGIVLHRRSDLVERQQCNKDEWSLNTLGPEYSHGRKAIQQRHVAVTDNEVRL